MMLDEFNKLTASMLDKRSGSREMMISVDGRLYDIKDVTYDLSCGYFVIRTQQLLEYKAE